MRAPMKALPSPNRFQRQALDRLFVLPSSLQAALAFAYWLIAAGSGLLAGLGIPSSLGFSALALAVTFGLARWHRHARAIDDGAIGPRLHRLIASSLLATIGGISFLVPLAVYLVLALWFLASIPVWLIRMP